MAQNYDDKQSKSDVRDALNSSTLPADIAAKILKSFGSKVNVDEFNTAPTGADVHGNDLVLISSGGTVDLSTISKADLKGVDSFVFTTNENVQFTLAGDNTTSFKGVISTSGGNDTIVANSKSGNTVSSGDGNDSVTTGSGKDSVNLGSGNDSVNTGAGNDSVSTGSGNDSVSTGAGNDSVLVGSGNDSVQLGAGNDIVKLALDLVGNAVLDGGEGKSDKLDLSSVVIKDVVADGQVFKITLDDNSVITATNFEKFVYDSNGDAKGGIKIVGAVQFDTHDFNSGS